MRFGVSPAVAHVRCPAGIGSTLLGTASRSGFAAFILCLAGFAGTALARGPHQRTVFHNELTAGRSRTLRIAGSTSLVAAIGVTIAEFGPAYGLAVLAALVNITGLIVALLLAGPLSNRLR